MVQYIAEGEREKRREEVKGKLQCRNDERGRAPHQRYRRAQNIRRGSDGWRLRASGKASQGKVGSLCRRNVGWVLRVMLVLLVEWSEVFRGWERRMVEAGYIGWVDVGGWGGYRGVRIGEARILGPYTEGGATGSGQGGGSSEPGHEVGRRGRSGAFDGADEEDPYAVLDAEWERGQGVLQGGKDTMVHEEAGEAEEEWMAMRKQSMDGDADALQGGMYERDEEDGFTVGRWEMRHGPILVALRWHARRIRMNWWRSLLQACPK